MPAKYRLQGMGWLPDFPDFRDRTPDHEDVEPLIARTSISEVRSLPARADLSPWCSPVENQESLGSCTANAAVGLYEYFERRAKGEYVDASRLFVYKTSRNLLHWTGDSGAFIRTAMDHGGLSGGAGKKGPRPLLAAGPDRARRGTRLLHGHRR